MMTYFLTISAHSHRNFFQRNEVAELLIAKIFQYRDAGEFQIHDYVIMPDHLHLLVTLNKAPSVARVVQLVKGGFSHALHRQNIAILFVWGAGYHDRRVRDLNEFAGIAAYIKNNPVKRGLVQEAVDYPYSSAAIRETLDPAPGLKPLGIFQEDCVDASLKARSTDFRQPENVNGATIKAGDSDANLAARSTNVCRAKSSGGATTGELHAGAKARSAGSGESSLKLKAIKHV